MNTPRRGCGLAVFKGKLFVVGGSDGTQSICSTEVYDPELNTWSAGPSMTSCRANVGVAVLNDRLYAVGGFSGKNFLNSIEFLDAQTNEWTNFTPKPECIRRIAEPVVEVDDSHDSKTICVRSDYAVQEYGTRGGFRLQENGTRSDFLLQENGARHRYQEIGTNEEYSNGSTYPIPIISGARETIMGLGDADNFQELVQ